MLSQRLMSAVAPPDWARKLRQPTRWVWLVALALSGCASGPLADARDPLEPLNRSVFQFNDAVDSAVARPLTEVYRKITPAPVRKGISNVFDNLQDAWSFVNNALQLKGRPAIDSLARLGVNTLLGFGGIFDPATALNIDKHTRDFGHTLGFWGVAPGPYLVLPLLGPSTLRDTAALAVDLQGDIASSIQHVPTRNSVVLVKALDTREGLLDASNMLEEAALDRYAFTRDSYLQLRRNAIFDGNPPDDIECEESNEKSEETTP
jgi:phospholipid-binding lipoprotein MlaA